MNLHITKVDIRNFRSVRNLTLSPAKLAVLVGKNDAGKSNILRALNLFFNGVTVPEEELDFDVDHNVFNRPNRQAKEISIKLEVELPESYQATNGDFVQWERRWRSNGLVHDKYVGQRRRDGRNGTVRLEEVDIPTRSNVHTLLRNINFIYVPAVKDLEYFSDLRASIYEVIADVADQPFRDSSQGFEQSISDQLVDLTTQITAALGFRSRLALPKDLSHIFESLDFLSEGQDISLNARGDGIKARHIPLILKFMADKKRSLQVRGAPPHTFIWAYEEPENNLELSSCVELADQFWGFADDGISQIFLTTHSPVFYNLHRKETDDDDKISCHHIYSENPEDGTKQATELDDLDDRMGTTALFAPLVTELEDKVRRRERARAEVEELAQANRRKIFVEGTSDKIFLEKALSVFAADSIAQIDVATHQRAGVSFVEAMLQSWRDHRKYNVGLPKAVGLLDADEPGLLAHNGWNKISKNRRSAKCFVLPTPPHVQAAVELGFKIPIVLEALYDDALLQWADGEGYLEDRDLLAVLPEVVSRRILTEQSTLDDEMEDEWSMYVRRQVTQVGKVPLAEQAAAMDNDDFSERMAFMEPLVTEIIAYLFPEAAEALPPNVNPVQPDQGEEAAE